MNLFVYGTLRDTRLVRRLVGRTFPTVPAELEGWRLIPPHASRSGYPEIVPDPASRVRGLLLCGVDPEALRRLDRYEEGYVRCRIRVRTQDGTVDAEVYVPTWCAKATTLPQDPPPWSALGRWLRRWIYGEASALVVVHAARTQVEAEVLRDVLHEAGIPVLVRPRGVPGYEGVLERAQGVWADLLVAEPDLDRAQAVIDEFFRSSGEAGSP